MLKKASSERLSSARTLTTSAASGPGASISPPPNSPAAVFPSAAAGPSPPLFVKKTSLLSPSSSSSSSSSSPAITMMGGGMVAASASSALSNVSSTSIPTTPTTSGLHPSASIVLINEVSRSLEESNELLRRMRIESTQPVFEILRPDDRRVGAVFKPNLNNNNNTTNNVPYPTFNKPSSFTGTAMTAAVGAAHKPRTTPKSPATKKHLIEASQGGVTTNASKIIMRSLTNPLQSIPVAPPPPVGSVRRAISAQQEAATATTTTAKSDLAASVSPLPPRTPTPKGVNAIFLSATATSTASSESQVSATSDSSQRLGLHTSERALRERAAYVLDKLHGGFSNVPATALAKINRAEGSLQEFVENDGSAEDNPEIVGKASPQEVQKIAVLDCLIFNLDRHAGNILVKVLGGAPRAPEGETEEDEEEDSTFLIGEEGATASREDAVVKLIPIDHGLSLPTWRCLSQAYFDWSFFPQAASPLTPETVKCVLETVDVEAGARELRALAVRESAVATYRICALILKAFVRETPEINLTQLASVYQRPYSVGHKLHDSMPSPLEHMVEEAGERVGMRREREDGGENAAPPPESFFAELAVIATRVAKSGEWKHYVV